LIDDETIPAPLRAPPALRTVDPARYTERETITQGGMGRIIAARDRRLGRRVAIKELREPHPELAARFEREAFLTARLEHPSIVGVHEAGRWPSGEPFYTMKLVPGRSLEEAIAAAPDLERRLALLPRVIAVADALAYAHGKRIIHRDLKPTNVMVGTFGETVVIDWGLAKDLAAPPDAPSAPSRPSGVGETVVGQVLGTPAYMPPEQAAGEAVDERADVYAIGAILHHLLAGEPPSQGGSAAEIVAAVRRAPPRPLRPPAPADLIDVVARAMARDPAARYPTARELASDLKKFQAGQLVGAHRYTFGERVRRWLRRQRRPVVVGGIALALLAVIGIGSIGRTIAERRRAEAQRRIADAHRGEAEELMTFMLFDLKDRLKPLNRLELLESVAGKAADVSGSDTRLHGAALRSLADATEERGDRPGALAVYRAGLAVDAALAARDPASVTAQRDVALDHENVGEVLAPEGDKPGALAELRAAQKILDVLGRDPSDRESLHILADVHRRLADVIDDQGDRATALEEMQAALALYERLVAADPGNTELIRATAETHRGVGALLQEQRHAAAALDEFRTSEAISRELIARDPTDALFLWQDAIANEGIGGALQSLGRATEALAAIRAALATKTRLAESDPANARWQRGVAVGHDDISDCLVMLGDRAAARAETRLALEVYERLVAKDPTNARWLEDVAESHRRVGRLEEPVGALGEFHASLLIGEELVTRDPTDGVARSGVSASHNGLGNALLKLGRPTEALAEFRVSLAMDEASANDDPSRRHDLAITEEDVGDALMALGDPAGALVQYRAELSLRERLAAEDPTDDAEEDVAMSHDSVGDALLAEKNVAGALVERRAAIDIFAKLAGDHPDVADWQAELSESHEQLGDELLASGDVEGARAEYEAALQKAPAADVAALRRKLSALR
jgi:tetratricopeptide (TPR) repeat protein